LVGKWIPPSRSEIVEIGKRTEGILGVNQPDLDVVPKSAKET
jgi:hypothetical protein